MCWFLDLVEASTHRRANVTCSMLTQVYNSFLELEHYVRMDSHSFIALHVPIMKEGYGRDVFYPTPLVLPKRYTSRKHSRTPHTCLSPAIDIHLFAHKSQIMEIRALSPETIQDTVTIPPDSIPADQIDSTFSTCIGNSHPQPRPPLTLLPL